MHIAPKFALMLGAKIHNGVSRLLAAQLGRFPANLDQRPGWGLAKLGGSSQERGLQGKVS
jgi:hypothetical protein